MCGVDYAEVRGSVAAGPPRMTLWRLVSVDGTRSSCAAVCAPGRGSRASSRTQKAVSPGLDALAAKGQPLGAEVFPQVLRFVLGEVERRSQERGLLCVAPGAQFLHLVREELARFDPSQTRTELVLVADERAESLAGSTVTCVTPSQIGTRRPFLVYYAEGPGYALVGEPDASAGSPVLFQTADRVTVEHLAFQLQRALGVPITR
jgi:hypothetical protein